MNSFFNDVRNGLSATPKHLSSKYFYDARGDELFQQLMNAEEYYLSRCELEILMKQSPKIAVEASSLSRPFDLIELGAGDASKSIHLIDSLQEAGRVFRYVPIDISKNIINLLKERLPRTHPSLTIEALNGEYIEMLGQHSKKSPNQKFILFLGSNIGNMNHSDALSFCRKVGSFMNPGDLFLIGFDLKKAPRRILSAYDDRDGLTRQFNLNLLTRINRELSGNFNLSDFSHYASYDPISGVCKSFLISHKNQKVSFNNGEETAEANLKENEPIFMEVSLKYDVEEIEKIAEGSGFKIRNHFFDSKKWFLDSLWEKT